MAILMWSAMANPRPVPTTRIIPIMAIRATPTTEIIVMTMMTTTMMTNSLGGLLRRRQQKIAASNQSGMTLIELIITRAILEMLASATLPLAYNTVRRNREIDLRRGLRELRQAIDSYKKYNDSTTPPGSLIPIQERTPTGYPKSLEILVKGFTPANRVDDKKIRFLRRIPVDPMTGKEEWGVKSSRSEEHTSELQSHSFISYAVFCL